MSKEPLPEAVSIKKAAEVLSVNEMTVRRWIQRGFLKAYRVGPFLIRIPRTELSRMRTLRITFEDNQEKPNYPKV